MKKLMPALTGLGILLLACQTIAIAIPTQEVISQPAIPVPEVKDMAAILKDMGGKPCEENLDFTCVTIKVPLDHFDTSRTDTLDIVFAVSPATGERYGMFIQAFPGGPGGEGVSTADLSWFSGGILEHYDIVYFDQRGVGLSNPISCPKAYAEDFLGYLNETNQDGLEGYDTPEEQQKAIDDTRTFTEKCMAEIAIDPSMLKFFGTDQVAEDIETFRQAIGDDKFMLYGVSYGTAVAQTYAAAHPNHLSGMILDGTMNLTLTGEEGALSQEKAFDKVLVATLNACNADKACTADMGGDALTIYDNLAKQISETPLAYEFPLPSGEKVKRTFTFNEWESTTAYQLYSLSGRMLFLRALAAANRGDMVPMARLLYQQFMLDPATFEYLGDPTFSDTMFLSVLCTDDSFFSGTQEEKIAKTIEAGQASNGTVPRLDGSVYTGLTCAFWPSSPTGVIITEPLKAEGITTFVLSSTLDPATPFEEGKAVFENLADGYHLYVEGGHHSIYGYGYDCPDKYITNFMVDGKLPNQREIVCEDWGVDVTWPYEPLVPADASEFADAMEAFQSFDGEMQLQPEYFYSYFEKDVTVACPFGGVFIFGPSDEGEAYTFDKCAYSKGFEVTGTGSYAYETGLFTIEATVSGIKNGMLTYTHNKADGSTSLTGEYGGEAVDITH
jgi:pimeloyl-ACP methyl ester carboxylesterase